MAPIDQIKDSVQCKKIDISFIVMTITTKNAYNNYSFPLLRNNFIRKRKELENPNL